jgi:DNA polymerase III delta prime subunit
MSVSPRLKTVFGGVLTQKRLAQAYLFFGYDDQELLNAAIYMGTWFNCADFSQDGPCLSCISCKTIASKNSTSLFVTEYDTEKISIETVRGLQKLVQFGVSESDKAMTVILPSADRLTSEAANAFLKTLEEPPFGVIFILTTTQPLSVLPTIRSRCQSVDIPSLPSGVEKEIQSFYRPFAEIAGLDLYAKLEYAQTLPNKEALKQVSLMWLDELVRTGDFEGKSEAIEALLKAVSDLRYNINLRLLAEALLISIHHCSSFNILNAV